MSAVSSVHARARRPASRCRGRQRNERHRGGHRVAPPDAPRNVANGAPFREAAKELEFVHGNGRDGLSARATTIGRAVGERRSSGECSPASLTAILGGHIVLPWVNATPQDTPHCFEDTRGSYRTVQLRAGSGRGSGDATWRPVAECVKGRKKDRLAGELGLSRTCATQPVVQSAASTKAVVVQYEKMRCTDTAAATRRTIT